MSFTQATANLIKRANIIKGDIIKNNTDIATECFICHKLFSITRRRHKCKSCLQAVCADCGQHKLPVPSFDKTNKPHRVCTQCYYNSPNIKKTPSIKNVPEYAYDNILTDPTQDCISVWLLTFNKCWLRSKYFPIYKQKQEELLEKAINSKPKTAEPALFRQRKTPPTSHDVRNEALIPEKENNPIIIIDAGQLWINIMDAVGIPDKQDCLLLKPDSYCVFYVTNNDECFGDNNKYRTKICKNTLHPCWNEEKTIKITNTTGTLVIELWHSDITDIFCGRLEIKLNSLFLHSHHYKSKENTNRIIDDWFEFKILQKLKKNNNNSPNNEKDRPSQPTLRKNTENAPIYTKMKSIPNVSNQKETGKCYVRLQIKFDSCWWAHFISHFDPVLRKPYKVKFHLPLTIEEINVIITSWGAAIGAWNSEQMRVLTWVNYKWSIIYLVLFISFIYHPWFAMFYMELRLLVYSCNVYVNLDELKKKHINLPLFLHIIFSLLGYTQLVVEKIIAQTIVMENDSINQSFLVTRRESEYKYFDEMYGENENIAETTENLINSDEKEEKEVADSGEISMSSFGQFATKRAIKVSGIKSKLWWFQESLVFMNDGVDKLQRVMNWDIGYAHITSLICIVLFILCIVSVLLKHTYFIRHQMCVIGIIGLSYYSKPMQFMLWIISGSTYWYFNCYRRYNQFMKDDKDVLFSSKIIIDSVKKEKDETIGYFMKFWMKITAFIGWIVMTLFLRAEKIENCDKDKEKVMVEQEDLKRKKSADGQKAERRRRLILKQIEGTFDKKFQFLISKLKSGKMVTF